MVCRLTMSADRMACPTIETDRLKTNETFIPKPVILIATARYPTRAQLV